MSKLPTITEQTAKRFKLIQLVGFLGTLYCLTASVLIWRSGQTDSPYFALHVVGFLISFLIYFIGRFLAWWFHG